MNDLSLKDFYPINDWKFNADADCIYKYYYRSEEDVLNDVKTPKYLIDQTTGRSYFNETENIVRLKCLGACVATPFVHVAASVANIAYRIAKLVTFSHFIGKRDAWAPSNFKAAGIDCLRVIFQPVGFAGLELSAIYGVLKPYDGRKLYASFERALYGRHILAPCFQPDPTCHLFGGDINKRNAW